MAFNNSLSALRRIGRSMVLPVDRIKDICKKVLTGRNIEYVLDFGSGTLFWADWFIKEFKSNVYAIDTYYDCIMMPGKDNIVYYSDLSICLNENKYFSLVWVCDVLHHLSPLDVDSFLGRICNKTDIMIIKDIDADHKFGNYINKMHDKIINSETVYSIYPKDLIHRLKLYGFKTSYYYIPKICYPHFILIGIHGKR